MWWIYSLIGFPYVATKTGFNIFFFAKNLFKEKEITERAISCNLTFTKFLTQRQYLNCLLEKEVSC